MVSLSQTRLVVPWTEGGFFYKAMSKKVSMRVVGTMMSPTLKTGPKQKQVECHVSDDDTVGQLSCIDGDNFCTVELGVIAAVAK